MSDGVKVKLAIGQARESHVQYLGRYLLYQQLSDIHLVQKHDRTHSP